MGHPLVEEATKKATLVWLDGQAAWCAWVDGALYVISGAGEQDLGDLRDGVLVTVRGDHGGRVISWPAAVTRVDPAGAEWAGVASQLAGKRLNASGTADETVARWASTCVLYALRPGADAVTGTGLPAGSLAEAVRETPATTPAKRPFKLHRVRKPARKT